MADVSTQTPKKVAAKASKAATKGQDTSTPDAPETPDAPATEELQQKAPEPIQEGGQELENGAETVKENGQEQGEGDSEAPEVAQKKEEEKPEEELEVKQNVEGEKPEEEQQEEKKEGEGEEAPEGEEQKEPEEVPDLSILEGKKVNKVGNIVDESGTLIGRLVEGDLKKLVGKTVDGEGQIWNDSGKVLGRAEALPKHEIEKNKMQPFEDFPDAVVDKSGTVKFEGEVVGRVIEGDAKQLAGKKVDADGDILDRVGNTLGKAERWEEEEPEEEPPPEAPDMSSLAGKRVNKLGNVVDANGSIFGRIVDGDPKKLAGKMCDKDGNIWNDGGQVIGKAELIPDSEREGEKEGPFTGFEGLTVNKEGKIVDAKGAIVGRLTEGEATKLYGKAVDDDGDILDKNGNVLGKAERWEEEAPPEKPKNPLEGRKVNREGNVVDDNGEVIGKLTEGTPSNCVGQEIDNDGDIVNSKGQTIGHAVLLENLPEEPEPEPEEPGETEEEKEKRLQLENDKKLAGQMAHCIQESIDKIKPILTMISDAIDTAERQPKEELDEQKLVDTVKPLIEQGGQILQEANGVIRGLDPDGRIAANAKHKTAAREASPEEYRLADLLKELTGSVTQTIDNAKKKIAGMPHAKKELNPLWGLLAEPLGQILAAVGLLLSGVLGLVGNLLSGLGLGGLVDGLLGGLGIKNILQNLGLGSISDALTGKKK